MQTFLPYGDFYESLRCLDSKRLGKQRVEAKQIINTLEGRSKGWKNHPAVLMWQNNIDALKLYYNISLDEWSSRGYRNIKLFKIKIPEEIECPYWLDNELLHASHRSNLLRKDYQFYSKYGWKEKNDREYYWPTKFVGTSLSMDLHR